MKTHLFIFCLFVLSAFASAQTYTFSTVAEFSSFANPWVAPTVDAQGNLYGLASGGTHNSGIAYKVTPSGALSTIYNFLVSDGNPAGQKLTRDRYGNLYGMTAGAGHGTGWGLIFKISSAGKRTILHKFSPKSYPGNSLARDAAGNLYGYIFLPPVAGVSHGSLFKLTPAGVYSILYSFCAQANCADGDQPVDGPTVDPSGNLFGAAQGGTFGNGVVFEFSAAGAESVLHTFTGGSDGGVPRGRVSRDAAGNLYGGTVSGGWPGIGIAYEIDTNDNEIVLGSFTGSGASPDAPLGPIISDAAGNVYGTGGGGPNGWGEAFEISQGQFINLHSFESEQSAWGMSMDAAGNLYGVSPYGGPNRNGSVYKLTKSN